MDLPPPIAFAPPPSFGAFVKPDGPVELAQRAREFRATLRRREKLRAAADFLPHLPGPGESLHALLMGYFDFALVLSCLIRSRPSRCEALRISTLTFSEKNAQELARLKGEGAVGRLALLCSHYHSKINAHIYLPAVALLAPRGVEVATARCHAKVACLAFADGLRLVFEGSMNLRTSRNVEQLFCANDAGLHDWHAEWIDQRMREHAEEVALEQD